MQITDVINDRLSHRCFQVIMDDMTSETEQWTLTRIDVASLALQSPYS